MRVGLLVLGAVFLSAGFLLTVVLPTCLGMLSALTGVYLLIVGGLPPEARPPYSEDLDGKLHLAATIHRDSLDS